MKLRFRLTNIHLKERGQVCAYLEVDRRANEGDLMGCPVELIGGLEVRSEDEAFAGMVTVGDVFAVEITRDKEGGCKS